MELKRIRVVGSLNTDLVTRMERLPRPGETISGGDMALYSGGKGANQAFAVARLGGRPAMVGEVGRDSFGEHLRATLRSAGVDIAGVGFSQRATGSACISVLPSGENAIVVSPGANAGLTPALALERLSDLQAGELVLLQLEVPLATVEAVLAFAIDRGAVSILDPAPARPLGSGALRNVGFLTPNQSEAAVLLGDPDLPIENYDQARDAARRLLKLGPSAVLLKLGSLGCFVATSEHMQAVPGFAVKAMDTTAAGDTFNGALAVGLSEGMPLAAAAKFANAAAALSVTRPGAQSSIPDRSETMEFLSAPERNLQEARISCS